ncbi:MAG: hypothetical protein MJE77_12155 [Proteobacteria bacterium]|nr:hypothetical protein [Pseudomonadota bacterium]
MDQFNEFRRLVEPFKLSLRPHGLPGRPITLSGIDGSGKTTLLRMLRAYLHRRGRPSHTFELPSRALKPMPFFRLYSVNPHRGRSSLVAPRPTRRCE